MNEKDRIYQKVESVIREEGKRSSYIGEDDFVSLVKGNITINYHLKPDVPPCKTTKLLSGAGLERFQGDM